MGTKSIAIIGTVGIPAQYGGFETLAENLVTHLAGRFNLTVFCSSKAYPQQLATLHGTRLEYLPLNANGVQSIFYDIWSIVKSLRNTDVLLILGVSGCATLPFIKPFYSGKIIVNIDGLEWKRDKWKGFARWFLKRSEKVAVHFADTVIADNRVIQQYAADSYGKTSELIAYGADHVSPMPLDAATLERFPFLSQPYAFSVCRIEPENNIHIILEAMANSPDLPLVLVGNWKASEYGRLLLQKFGNIRHLHLLDPIYDPEKLNPIRSNCSLYLHGHSSGGTNPSLVEAMYLNLPVAAYDVDYNRETTENRALYFSNSGELHNLVASLMNINTEEIARQMHEIAWRRYRWSVIAEAYAALF